MNFYNFIDYKWVGDKDQKRGKNKKDKGIIDCEEPTRNSDIFNLLKGKFISDKFKIFRLR